MTGSSIAYGLRTARRSPGLVALLWLWTVLLSALAAYPAWVWLGRGFDFAPESDRMLSGFSISTFVELGQYDRSSVSGVLTAVLAGVALLALVTNPLVCGGLMESLTSSDDSTQLRRFLRGGAAYFWRYARLLLCGVVTAAVVLALLSAAFSPLAERLEDSAWEPAGLLGSGLQAIVLFLAAGLLLTALDFARARIALEDRRSAVRAWFGSLGFVLRRAPSALMLFLAPVILFAIVLLLYGVFVRYTPSHTAALIFLLITVQQLVMFCRAYLRVSLVASVLEYARRTAPPPAPTLESPWQPAGTAAPEAAFPAAEETRDPDEEVQI